MENIENPDVNEEDKQGNNGTENSGDEKASLTSGELFAGIIDQIEELKDLFIKKIERSQMEEEIITNMDAELQKYKTDMYAQLIVPIFKDIIDLRESFERFIEKSKEGLDIEDRLKDYSTEMMDILDRYGVETYNSVEHELYNPQKQKVIKKIDTDDENLNGKVAEIMNNGYQYNGKPIYPERVAVYKYSQNSKTE